MPEPDDVIAYQEGSRLFREGKLLEALARFRIAATTGADRPMEHFALATAHLHLGQLDEAEHEYRAFLAMRPELPRQLQAAAAALDKILRERQRRDERDRRDEEQRRQAERLEQIRKLHEEALAFYRAAGYDSALRRLQEVKAAWGPTPEVLNLQALCLFHQGHGEQAIAALADAHHRFPDDVDCMLNLAMTRFVTGARSAADLLRRVVQASPDHADAWFNLGVAELALGDYEEAESAWRQAARLQPDDAGILADLKMLEGRKR